LTPSPLSLPLPPTLFTPSPPTEAASSKKRKESSKKGQKKTLQTPTPSTPSKHTPKEPPKDLSTAILTSSTTKNTLVVVEAPNAVGHTVVGLSEATMENLEIFEGDSVQLKGKRGKTTVATVVQEEHGGEGITLTTDAMKNAGVR
jgi:anaerobic selenocysteine-containing dehydrogenase